ncbi:hypothetical protein D3C78_1733380 [compost metagenome]
MVKRHVFPVQYVIAVLEVRVACQLGRGRERGRHRTAGTGGICGGCWFGSVREGGLPSGVGMYKGPLYPQAATMPVATSVATMRRTMRRNAKWNTGNS